MKIPVAKLFRYVQKFFYDLQMKDEERLPTDLDFFQIRLVDGIAKAQELPNFDRHDQHELWAAKELVWNIFQKFQKLSES